MEELTTSQEKVLIAIKKLIAKNGFPPTVREIGKESNLSSPATIHFHLTKLEEKGYIKKGNNTNRTIELLVDNEFVKKKKEVVELALLDKDTANSFINSLDSCKKRIVLPSSMVEGGKVVFAFVVSGDSMIKAGILDGDIVLVEKREDVRNGDKVVAMSDTKQISVKTFYKENNYFRLQPENDNMATIILKEVSILGKVIGLYRKIK